jgi:hypothetical protein
MMKSIISKDMALNVVLDMMVAIEKLTGNRITGIKIDHSKEYQSICFENKLL